ncbi:MAG: hypothetical protein ACREHV_06940, partial [Rhizomicrobium sp.]
DFCTASASAEGVLDHLSHGGAASLGLGLPYLDLAPSGSVRREQDRRTEHMTGFSTSFAPIALSTTEGAVWPSSGLGLWVVF